MKEYSKMRLIDADTVYAILTRLIEEQKKSHNLNEVIGLMEARTEVNNAPTIDPVPVVHARWIKSNYDNIDGTIYKCPNCNTEFFNAWNYCPQCGAKMDS